MEAAEFPPQPLRAAHGIELADLLPNSLGGVQLASVGVRFPTMALRARVRPPTADGWRADGGGPRPALELNQCALWLCGGFLDVLPRPLPGLPLQLTELSLDLAFGGHDTPGIVAQPHGGLLILQK